MKSNSELIQKLYDEYYGEKYKARHSYFEALSKYFSPMKVLYPGGFIHINASYVFPDVTYVDNNKNAIRFFKIPADVLEIISKQKSYDKKPTIQFFGQNYEDTLPIAEESYDLIISLFAGFVSLATKKYLTKGGLLVANDSHGDASMANLDPELKFIGVLFEKDNKLILSRDELQSFFKPKGNKIISKELLLETNKGPKYILAADHYVFEKR